MSERVAIRPGPPRRREREILEAAASVFHQRGYERSTIQEIAEEVGILKGSLYYYFDTKEDLLYEILQEVHTEAMRNIDIVDAIDGDALEKLHRLVAVHLTFNAQNLIRMRVFFQDFRSLSDERRHLIVKQRDMYEGFLRDLIAQGQKENVVCPDFDPKLIAMGILGMMNWIHHWYKPDGESSAEKIAEEFADLVVTGLHCTPGLHEVGHRSKLRRWRLV